MNERFTLFQINNMVKQALSKRFDESYWVVAEISDMNENRSGHCYVEFVEKDERSANITAKARGTIWAYSYRMIKPYFETATGQSLRAGLKVLVRATVEFSEIYGYTLNVTDIDPVFTVGDLHIKRLQVIRRLNDEGIFDLNRSLELTMVPQRIAVISSPTAAGWGDFSHQLDNNPQQYKFYVKLFPAIMQGNECAPSVIAALDKIFAYENEFDVVVIIRGGGSKLDLAAFDDYQLAANIAQFPLPVVTGIGHERDQTIADMVAHTSLKTPTAVAEMLISQATETEAYIENLRQQFLQTVTSLISAHKQHLERIYNHFTPKIRVFLAEKNTHLQVLQQQILSSSRLFAMQKRKHLQTLTTGMQTRTQTRLITAQHKVEILQKNLLHTALRYLMKHKYQLDILDSKAQQHDVMRILQKGYSITTRNGKPLRSVLALKTDDTITTHLADGNITSTVQGVEVVFYSDQKN